MIFYLLSVCNETIWFQTDVRNCLPEWAPQVGLSWITDYCHEQLLNRNVPRVSSGQSLSLSLVKQDISLQILIPGKAEDIQKGSLLTSHFLSLSNH